MTYDPRVSHASVVAMTAPMLKDYADGSGGLSTSPALLCHHLYISDATDCMLSLPLNGVCAQKFLNVFFSRKLRARCGDVKLSCLRGVLMKIW